MRYPHEISCFLAVMRCPCEILCFLLHNFRTRYPKEISCFLGRYELCVSHVFLALRRFLNEISLFLAAEFSFGWRDVRTVERWILKDAGD